MASFFHDRILAPNSSFISARSNFCLALSEKLTPQRSRSCTTRKKIPGKLSSSPGAVQVAIALSCQQPSVQILEKDLGEIFKSFLASQGSDSFRVAFCTFAQLRNYRFICRHDLRCASVVFFARQSDREWRGAVSSPLSLPIVVLFGLHVGTLSDRGKKLCATGAFPAFPKVLLGQKRRHFFCQPPLKSVDSWKCPHAAPISARVRQSLP
jgi:hypothetical protein